MKKILKWLVIVLGSLVGLILVVGVVMFLLGDARLNKVYDFPPSNIAVPTDEASIAYGRHRAEILCSDCHGADLGGVVQWFNVSPLGTIDSANLTVGEGGVGQVFTSDEDYVQAMRHGIGADGKPIYMPAVPATARLSDKDLGAIIAYLKTVPPVDRKTNGHQFSPVAKILFVAGVLPGLPVEMVSHETNVAAPEAGVSAEYGEYLVNINDCRTCHGQNLAGGKHPDPSIKARVPNLTPGGEPGFWTEEQFMTAIREGRTPGGHQLDPQLMPWKNYRALSDDELQAIWLYLQSQPKLQTNP
jgi:mono/diheme cytochrome c family protein